MPVYCETGHPWFGIAEPVNFFTNALILLAAIAATVRLLREKPSHPTGLWLLVVLLYATGIGSALWHGLRTYWALRVDSLSGLFFLLALVGLWAGQLWGRIRGWLATFGFVVLSVTVLRLSLHLMGDVPKNLRPVMFLPFFIEVIAVGAVLVQVSYIRAGRRAARLGIATVVCGMIAAVGRSLDMVLCAWLPFGSHFIWHTFLSLAAYLGICALMALMASEDESRLHAEEMD